MSDLSQSTPPEALASPVTSNLLALLFVAVASTTPVLALPITWFHDDSTYVSKPVEVERITLDPRALRAPAARTKLAKTFAFGSHEATVCLRRGIVTAEEEQAIVVHRDVVTLCGLSQHIDYMRVRFATNEGNLASRWWSERTAVIVPQAMEPDLGNVELHLMTAGGRNIKVTQKTRRGAEEPDALSITVPDQFDDDDDTGLYCYVSEDDSGFIQQYFADGINDKRSIFSSEVNVLFRIFF
jgi:hypothetical protein